MSASPPDDSISKNRAKPPKRVVSAAIQNDPQPSDLPKIIAAGRGKIAEQILEIAFANGLKVREDPALAEMLASIELDSPIPTEALVAVAEILAYVYEADGKERPDPADPFKVPEKKK